LIILAVSAISLLFTALTGNLIAPHVVVKIDSALIVVSVVMVTFVVTAKDVEEELLLHLMTMMAVASMIMMVVVMAMLPMIIALFYVVFSLYFQASAFTHGFNYWNQIRTSSSSSPTSRCSRE
jgi:hypothetical protein